MRIFQPYIRLSLFLSVTVVFLSFNNGYAQSSFKIPYKKSGLTEKQAAAHLLDRFTFGSTPGGIEEVVNIGLANWFQQQLDGNLPDDSLTQKLKEFDALKMSNEEIVTNFPRNFEVLAQAIKEGYINKDSVKPTEDKARYKEQVKEFMKQKGYRPEQDLVNQLICQKILSAAYSNNQLHEVLTDFWFNHFNVSFTKSECLQFILAYERDAIRKHVTGKFYDLLLATAQSPAMLIYLDNFSSSGTNEEADIQQQKNQKKLEAQLQNETIDSNKVKILQKLKRGGPAGLNENYAREVMELHTLGVDGGYTQTDVTQAARVLTGWTIFPMGEHGPNKDILKKIEKEGEQNLTAKGYIHQGDFLFAMNKHDDKEKKVLGNTFVGGGGYQEGVQLISILAHHASTAKFICKKIATHFVSDNPPQSLIDKMVSSFVKNDGDIKKILITMVSSPEFWAPDALREKTKSPFELAISTVRSLKADVKKPLALNNWITKMGQQIYYYQAPTGFPDKGVYWINTGSLLNRMNFGLAIAGQKLSGISFNLLALNNNHEPESAEAALPTYCKLIMPERNIDATVKRLIPLIKDPSIQHKINATTKANNINDNTTEITNTQGSDEMFGMDVQKKLKNSELKTQQGFNKTGEQQVFDSQILSQVVGIIIGCPEFQRK